MKEPEEAIDLSASPAEISAEPQRADRSDSDVFQRAAAPLREALSLKRSTTLLRLFEFLAKRSLEDNPPNELEIANEVFSDGKVISSTQDSTVRVYVHRLRKLAEHVYADVEGPVIEIPKGGYRIRVTDTATHIETDVEPSILPAAAVPEKRRKQHYATLIVAIVAVLLSGFLILGGQAEDPLANTTFWRPLAKATRPTTIILGDRYLFSDASEIDKNRLNMPKMIWDQSIKNRDDLYVHQMKHPEMAKQLGGYDENYVSSSSIIALGQIRRAVMQVKASDEPIGVLPASALTADILKSSDIIYIGELSLLHPLLEGPLLEASSLKAGATVDEIIDRKSGKIYQTDAINLTEERIPRRDYGYIARLVGPTGNNIFVISGIRDAGLLEMAELVGDAARLDVARLPVNTTKAGMEALYRVRTMGSVNAGSGLVMKRKMSSQGVWDKSYPAANQ
jgi:hypothetical protein